MQIDNLRKNESSNSGGVTALIVLFVIILLVLVGGGGYLYQRQQDQEQRISGYLQMDDVSKGMPEEISGVTESDDRSGEVAELNVETPPVSGSLGRV